MQADVVIYLWASLSSHRRGQFTIVQSAQSARAPLWPRPFGSAEDQEPVQEQRDVVRMIKRLHTPARPTDTRYGADRARVPPSRTAWTRQDQRHCAAVRRSKRSRFTFVLRSFGASAPASLRYCILSRFVLTYSACLQCGTLHKPFHSHALRSSLADASLTKASRLRHTFIQD